MKKYFMIIALIALIAFIAVPVQAWTQQWTNTTGTAYGHLHSSKPFDGLQIKNITKLNTGEITRIDWSGEEDWSGAYGGTAYTAGTFTVPLYIGSTLVGNGTWSRGLCTQGGGGSFSTVSSHSLEITGFSTVTTGQQMVKFYSDGWSNVTIKGRYMHGSYNPFTTYPFSDTFSAAPFAISPSEYPYDFTVTTYGGSNVVTPVSSFTCTPTSQYPDTNVVCTDTSTNTPTSWLWTIDAESWGTDAFQTHTGQNFSWQSHYPGIFSVNLQATNGAGSDYENKTNYVTISVNATPNNCDIEPLTGYIRTYAQTNDGMTSAGIFGSNIQMKDVEGSAWSNVTGSAGWWCIDTLPGHSLNLYAQATGYTSVESIGVSANGGRHYLVMWPDYISAPSAGNVTLYVLVYDQQTGGPLYLSSVRVDGNTINTFLKNTGPEGQAMFTIKNDSSVHVTASKSGYTSITKVITTSHFGPDTVMISLPRVTVTGSPTSTPTPSWMTTAPTVGPGPQGTMPPGYTNTQGQIMMDFLARNGLSLVELCFFVTILALLGVKFGK
jgi:PKD repeat protein